MKQCKTESYKQSAELKSDMSIILSAQTGLYIHEIQSQVWPLLMGRQPDESAVKAELVNSHSRQRCSINEGMHFIFRK